MKSGRSYKIGMLLALLTAVVSFILPDSFGDTRPMLFGIALVVFPVLLIAFLISKNRAKKRSKPEPAPAAAPDPVPAPTRSTAHVEPTAKQTTTTERVHVRGLDHHIENIEAVAMENPDYDLTRQELIDQYPDEKVWQYIFSVKGSLVPEPENPTDPNAIMVQADGRCIGYVPKGSTSHVRKLMESGRIQSMSLDIGGGKYKEVYENEDDKYEMDRGERPFSAVLELHLAED